jgi:hypothetical protein
MKIILIIYALDFLIVPFLLKKIHKESGNFEYSFNDLHFLSCLFLIFPATILLIKNTSNLNIVFYSVFITSVLFRIYKELKIVFNVAVLPPYGAFGINYNEWMNKDKTLLWHLVNSFIRGIDRFKTFIKMFFVNPLNGSYVNIVGLINNFKSGRNTFNDGDFSEDFFKAIKVCMFSRYTIKQYLNTYLFRFICDLGICLLIIGSIL